MKARRQMGREEQKKAVSLKLMVYLGTSNAVDKLVEQIDKIYNPEPKPCPENYEANHVYEDEEADVGTGKQPAKQPEIKAIATHKWDTPERASITEQSRIIDLNEAYRQGADAQLAADKSHCAECKERQKEEMATKNGLIHINLETMQQQRDYEKRLESENTSLKSQLNKQEEL